MYHNALLEQGKPLCVCLKVYTGSTILVTSMEGWGLGEVKSCACAYVQLFMKPDINLTIVLDFLLILRTALVLLTFSNIPHFVDLGGFL